MVNAIQLFRDLKESEVSILKEKLSHFDTITVAQVGWLITYLNQHKSMAAPDIKQKISGLFGSQLANKLLNELYYLISVEKLKQRLPNESLLPVSTHLWKHYLQTVMAQN